MFINNYHNYQILYLYTKWKERKSFFEIQSYFINILLCAFHELQTSLYSTPKAKATKLS